MLIGLEHLLRDIESCRRVFSQFYQDKLSYWGINTLGLREYYSTKGVKFTLLQILGRN